MNGQTGFKCKLEQLRRRTMIDSALKRAALLAACLSGAYALLLLISRLTGLLPDFFSLPAAAIPIAVGVALGLLLHSRSSLKEAARLADAKLGSKDLFLTAVALDSAFGDYKPLVLGSANEASERIKPAEIMKPNWRPLALNVSVAAAVLLLLSAFLPQLDPFGKKQAQAKKKEDAALLNKIDSMVKSKLEQIKRQPEGKNSAEVAKAIEDLKKEFDSLKLGDKAQNAMKLQEMRKELNELLKAKSEERLQDMLNRSGAQQSFGKLGEKAGKWKEELKKGELSGLKAELADLKRKLEEIAKTKDPEERQKKLDELKKDLKELSSFNKSELGSKSLQEALDTASMELGMQCESAGACEAAGNAMKLSDAELDKIGKMLEDINDLESAARALQLAKSLNELDAFQLKEGDLDGLMSIEEYEACYVRMMGNCKKGGKGGVEGGLAGSGGYLDNPEDIKTGVKDERSRSKSVRGKTLMEWKVKEVGASGPAKEEYLESVKEVKQGVSEAIVKEQAPPGYHDAIKSYFGSLGAAEGSGKGSGGAEGK